MYISPAAPIAIRIAAFSVTSAVSESGLFISKPGSLIKFAVTIKKIRRIKTAKSENRLNLHPGIIRETKILLNQTATYRK